MNTKKYISSKLRQSLNENRLIYENNDRYVLLHYHEYNEDFDEYDIDEYEAADIALEIAKNSGISILRDKRLFAILIDTKLTRVIGAIWISDSSNKFSFDIAIVSSYRNMGLSNMLIEEVINEYKSQKDMYDDMGEDFEMEVDVINPKLAQILKNKYGFYVTAELSQNRVLMSLD